MAHRSSAAGLHAARVVLRNCELTPKPEFKDKLRADDVCLSIVIDCATNVHLVVALRPELKHWQEVMYSQNATTLLAQQLAIFFRKVIEAFEAVPKYPKGAPKIVTTLQTPPQFMSRPEKHELSKHSMEAARWIFHHYDVTFKRRRVALFRAPVEETFVLDKMAVATLVETSLNLSRAMAVEDMVRSAYEGLRRGNVTEKQVKASLRAVGVLLNLLPTYHELEEETKLLS